MQKNLELLYEEKLLEKIALNIKIIEVVCEAFGQLVVQSIVLLRLKTLIQTDYFKYLGENMYSTKWIDYCRCLDKKTETPFQVPR